MSGVGPGIFAENNGSGALSITTLGTVTGKSSEGIIARNAGTELTIDARGDVSGDNHGIFAENEGTGALTITTSGNVLGDGVYGIGARNEGTALTIDAKGDVRGGQVGIVTRHEGSGDLTVTISGAVTGGGTGMINGFDDGSALFGKGGTFTIASTGSLAGGTGPAFEDITEDSTQPGNGLASSTLNVYGALNGNALMGRGSDALNVFSTATLADGIILNGGDDRSSADGEIDTLTFSGFEGEVLGRNLLNWERIVVEDNATVSFGEDSLSGGAVDEADTGLITRTGGTVQAFSWLTVVGNMQNSGRLTMQDGDAKDRVTVSGNLVGGGAVLMDVDLAEEKADFLQVNGSATETTTLFVSNIGGPAAQDGADVDVARVSGATQENAFRLAAPVEAGAFAYDLRFRTEGASIGESIWFLRNAGFGVTAAVYESAPSVLLGGFADMPTLEQRIGQRQWAGAASGGGTWLRTTGNWTNVTQGSSSAAASYEQAALGLQVGYDLAPIAGPGGEWVLGVTGQFGQVNTDVSNAFGVGEIDSEGYGIGATATWYGNSGTYVDLQGQVNWIDSSFATAGGAALRDGVSSTAYALSAEVGHRFAVSENAALIPQAQLTWGQIDGASFTDAQGNAVSWGSHSSLIGRIGLAYEYSRAALSDGSGDGTANSPEHKFYVIGNLLQDFSNSSSVNLNASNLTARNSATWAEVGIGGSLNWNDNTTLYTEANFSTDLGSGAGSNEALSISAGFRLQF